MLPASTTANPGPPAFWWEQIHIIGPGPSPWYHCETCGMRFRTLAFVRATPPACPACEATR